MIEIKILDQYAEITYKESLTNKTIKKIVGISEIPALFDTKISFDSGILPIFGKQNAYGVQRIIQRDDSYIVLIQGINPFLNVLHTNKTVLSKNDLQEMGVRNPIDFNSADIVEKKDDYNCYKNVYFPNLLMSLNLKKSTNGSNKYSVCQSGILGFKEAFITDQTQLYELPYSNIYRGGTHGGICWGDVRPVCDTLAQSVGVMQTFLGSVMNTHLFDEFNIGNYELGCSSELLAYLSYRYLDKNNPISSFPYDEIKLNPVIKYSGLINYLTENWK